MKRITLIVLLVIACSKKKQEAPKPEPASGSVVAVVDAAPEPPKAKAELLPAKLGEKEGVVFAERQGDPVSGIPDGTKVEIASTKESMVGAEEDSEITVKFEGKEVKLKADRVIVEEGLKRSPDGKHAVFTVVTTCGDLCHTAIYLLSANGKRTKLGEGGPDSTVAWTADKVAVGNFGLWIVTLADHVVKHPEDLTSPSFAPDGTLYARNHDGVAFKFDGDKPTQVWKPKKKKKSPDSDEEPDEDPEPVKFVDGKPKYD